MRLSGAGPGTPNRLKAHNRIRMKHGAGLPLYIAYYFHFSCLRTV